MRRRDLIFGLLGVTALPLPSRARTTPRYVVGSTLISDIILDLLGGEVELRELIVGVACPGHTDVKATDLVFALRSNSILVHGFQRRLPSLQQMLSIEPRLRSVTRYIDVRSSWLIPSVQIEATQAIASLLELHTSESARNHIRARLQERIGKIRSMERNLDSIRTALHGKRVFAAKMQEDFLAWTGLHIAGTYGSADTLDPRSMVDLIREGRRHPIIGVIDNLQSGPDTGRPIAEELRVPRRILSNFPKSSETTPDYFSLISDNMRRLASLVERN